MGKFFKDLSYVEGELCCNQETRQMRKNYVTLSEMSEIQGQVVPIVVKGRKRFLHVPQEMYEQIMKDVRAQNKKEREFSKNSKFVQELKTSGNNNPYNAMEAEVQNNNITEEFYR